MNQQNSQFILNDSKNAVKDALKNTIKLLRHREFLSEHINGLADDAILQLQRLESELVRLEETLN